MKFVCILLVPCTGYKIDHIQYTVYNGHTVYSIQFTVHSIQYTVYSIQYTVNRIQYTVNSIQYTVYIIV